MSVVGFRSFPDGFAYVVLSGTQQNPRVVAFDRLVFPNGSSTGGALAWTRKQLVEILTAHDITGASLKTVEPMAKTKSAERYLVDAIIHEVVYSKAGLNCTPRIKSQLKRDIKGFNEPARYLAHVLEKVPELEQLNKPNYEDATLAAIAELPAN